MKKPLLVVLLAILTSTLAWPAAEALLVPPSTESRAGRVLNLTVYLNNPSADPYDFVVPDTLHVDLASTQELRRLVAVAVGLEAGAKIRVAPMSFTTLQVAIVVPDTIEGTVSLRVLDLHTNAVMFNVTAAESVKATPRAIEAAERAVESRGDDVDLATDRESMRRHISSYEPIYFAVGFRDGANARFQFSFKYLLVNPNTNAPRWYHSVYLGYTQTSLWDLSSPSKPFYDTSYKPTLFYYHEALTMKPSWLARLGLQAGVQHESNGKGAADSRSLNTAYVTPILVWEFPGEWKLGFAPRLIAYAEKTENADLARYRGNVDYVIRFGKDKGLQVNALLRKGNGTGYGSADLTLTYPLRYLPVISTNAGGYLQVQYFNGWGESLLDYNKRRDDQLRIGYSLTR